MYQVKKVIFILVNFVLLSINAIVLYNTRDLYYKMIYEEIPEHLQSYEKLFLLIVVFFGPIILINALFINFYSFQKNFEKTKNKNLEDYLILKKNSDKFSKLELSNYLYILGNCLIIIITFFIVFFVFKNEPYGFNNVSDFLSFLLFLLTSIFSVFMIFDAINISKALK